MTATVFSMSLIYINHAVVTDANSPALATAKFPAAGWSGSVAQCKDSCFNGIVYRGAKLRKLFFRVWLLARSILSMASSNGTGVSPEAMASSYARISPRSSSSSRSLLVLLDADDNGNLFTAPVHNEGRSFPMGSSLAAVYSGEERRTIETV